MFTDLGLPGQIDRRTLGERAKLLVPSIKVLITTAYAGHLLVGEGRLESGIELLSKPLTFSAIATRVRQVLDARTSGRRANHILVVEDEFLPHAFIDDALAQHGFRADFAADFKGALRKIRGGCDDLVAAVVDMGLPDGHNSANIPKNVGYSRGLTTNQLTSAVGAAKAMLRDLRSSLHHWVDQCIRPTTARRSRRT
ncbi:hypothetical protein H8A97_15825 [Bradyrhizobium sp. Arg62]|uniref:hypothetical protein n=1 Tax=Bradyrhizobium brasilense TaxID=1419277 RepID=UPI001E29FC7E|nr:hypothetical protein [Bradyrhizobium brasilense]MCC8946542.1 hypothetical protein [Bradyrhizobium brasilense]